MLARTVLARTTGETRVRVQTYFFVDVMVCGPLCVFLRMMSFCICEIKVAWS